MSHNKKSLEQEILFIAKDLLVFVSKQLVSKEQTVIYESRIKTDLSKWFETRDSDHLPNTKEIFNAIIKEFFAISKMVQYLKNVPNGITIEKLPAQDAETSVLQAIDSVFEDRLRKLDLEPDPDGSVRNVKKNVNELDESDDLPESWVLNEPDSHVRDVKKNVNGLDESDTDAKFSNWANEISEMQDRIRRRRTGE